MCLRPHPLQSNFTVWVSTSLQWSPLWTGSSCVTGHATDATGTNFLSGRRSVRRPSCRLPLPAPTVPAAADIVTITTWHERAEVKAPWRITQFKLELFFLWQPCVSCLVVVAVAACSHQPTGRSHTAGLWVSHTCGTSCPCLDPPSGQWVSPPSHCSYTWSAPRVLGLRLAALAVLHCSWSLQRASKAPDFEGAPTDLVHPPTERSCSCQHYTCRTDVLGWDRLCAQWAGERPDHSYTQWHRCWSPRCSCFLLLEPSHAQGSRRRHEEGMVWGWGEGVWVALVRPATKPVEEALLHPLLLDLPHVSVLRCLHLLWGIWGPAPLRESRHIHLCSQRIQEASWEAGCLCRTWISTWRTYEMRYLFVNLI